MRLLCPQGGISVLRRLPATHSTRIFCQVFPVESASNVTKRLTSGQKAVVLIKVSHSFHLAVKHITDSQFFDISLINELIQTHILLDSENGKCLNIQITLERHERHLLTSSLYCCINNNNCQRPQNPSVYDHKSCQ